MMTNFLAPFYTLGRHAFTAPSRYIIDVRHAKIFVLKIPCPFQLQPQFVISCVMQHIGRRTFQLISWNFLMESTTEKLSLNVFGN